MKINELRCPNCNAVLSGDSDVQFCSFCGTKIHIDDESQKVNIDYNHTNRIIDEAQIAETNSKERIRLREIELEERNKTKELLKAKSKLIIGISCILFLLIISFFSSLANKPKKDEVALPSSVKDYIGLNYELVLVELQNVGFTDITCMPQHEYSDAPLNSVLRISISGNAAFKKNDVFSKSAPVVITYQDSLQKVQSKVSKNGFDENTNVKLEISNYSFDIPNYWTTSPNSDNEYTAFAETGDTIAMLYADLFIYDANMDYEFIKQDQFVTSFSNSILSSFDSGECKKVEPFECGNINGVLFFCDIVFKQNPATMTLLLLPTNDENTVMIISLIQFDSTIYDYSTDYLKIINSVSEI